MPKFSTRSLKNLKELHPLLQRLLNEAIKEYDFVVMDAQRGRAEQELAFRGGFSKVHFGNSAHNFSPAIATDIAPYPVDWDDARDDGRDGLAAFTQMQMKVILPLAKKLQIPIRLGIDFNMDGNLKNDGFKDYPHIELHPWREWAKKSKLIKD